MKHNILIATLGVLALAVIGLIAYIALKPDRVVAPVAMQQKTVTQKSAGQSVDVKDENNKIQVQSEKQVASIDAQKYLSIKEFGIQVPVSVVMYDDLSVKIIKDENSDCVNIYSKKLSNIHQYCSKDGFYHVCKLVGKTTDKEYADWPGGAPVGMQFNGFFITSSRSSDYCVVGDNAGETNIQEKTNMQLQDNISAEFGKALVSAEPIN